jgi:hypothetical protein
MVVPDGVDHFCSNPNIIPIRVIVDDGSSSPLHFQGAVDCLLAMERDKKYRSINRMPTTERTSTSSVSRLGVWAFGLGGSFVVRLD